MEEEKTNFENLLNLVGEWGYYQWALVIIIFLPTYLLGCWVGYGQHWCRPPGNLSQWNLTIDQWKDLAIPVISNLDSNRKNQTQMKSSCKMYAYRLHQNAYEINASEQWDCTHGWDYDRTNYDETAVTEFDLVCSNNFWPTTSLIVFNLGSVVGNFISGHLADRWGRKISLLLCILFASTFSAISSITNDVRAFTSVRFIVGITFPAVYIIPDILALEMVGTKYRILTNAILSTMLGVSLCCLGLIASTVRHWRLLLRWSLVPAAMSLISLFIVPESPRWLLSRQRYVQAARHLIKIGRINRRQVDRKLIYETSKLVSDEENALERQSDKRPTIYDLFRTKNIRKNSIIVLILWFVNSNVYNGLLYNVPNLQLNDYLSFILSAAVEIPAALLTWPLMSMVGRRWAIAFTMWLSGGAAIIVPAFSNMNGWYIGGLSILSKFAISCSFTTLYGYTNELYPTTIRAIGMSMGSVVGGFGVILAPYVVYLATTYRQLPMVTMGALSLSTGFLGLLLPETLNLCLPNTIAEAEQLFSNNHNIPLFTIFKRKQRSNSLASTGKDMETFIK